MNISKNSAVSLNYKLTDDDGAVLDSSEGGDPLTYIHGAGMLIPGLEKELEGKAGGDELKVRVPPEEAYGLRDDSKIHAVPKSQLPADVEIVAGMQFQAQSESGVHILTALEVGEESVKMDANHPLAGKALNFDVTVVEVREATAEELQHGHVHGPGGHSH